MASSSGISRSPCSNTKCENAIYYSRSGWKRLHPEVAFCNQCYIAYRKKQYCYIYHKNSTFWSFCKFCNKKIHRSCRVAKDWYTTLEDGGIMCNGCAPLADTPLVASSQETTPTPVTIVPQTLVENNQIIVEENLQEAQQSTPSACESYKNKSRINEKPHCGTSSRRHDQYRYIPRMTDEELNKIFKGLNKKVTPLFEKILSASDTGKSGRLVVPKNCAEEFFPSVDDGGESQPVIIQDSTGKNWNFSLRMWPNNNSRMYVLEGFEAYKRSMKLVEGDTVTFSRLDPEGKLVIGNRKVPSPSSQDGLIPKAKTTSPCSRRAKRAIVTSTTSKPVRKRKSTSTTRKSSVVSDSGTAKAGVGSKRKTCVTGLTRKSTERRNKRLQVVERDQGLVDSPRGGNVPSVVVGKGFKRSRNKDILRTNTSKHVSKRKNKSTARNSNIVISTIEPEEPSEPVDIVIALPVPSKWIKKHPRHRSRCSCIVCTQPASRSMHTGSSSTMLVEPESANINDQMTTICSSEDNQHVTRVSGSDTKVLPFDLNLRPEPEEEFMDACDLDQETSSGGNM